MKRTAVAHITLAAAIGPMILFFPLVQSFGWVPTSHWRVSLASFSVARNEVDLDLDVPSSTSDYDDTDDAAERERRHLRFSGIGRLYYQNQEQDLEDAHLGVVDKLATATCAVVGVGGVGSWAAEALCRSGVGNVSLLPAAFALSAACICSFPLALILYIDWSFLVHSL